ncbi:uncharacterized protein LOC143039621 [Oratosquilla oratoria]|uniref:uncharacterized protein LOC143039621 n=1 Tax=Oratosquilla oratoria TaxID=337810 RepID=UPI003F76676A
MTANVRTSSSECQDQQFRMLHKSGSIRGIFFVTKMLSIIQCARKCSNTSGCTAFGYDATLRNCQVFTSPYYSQREIPPSPDFNLYMLEIYPGSRLVLLGTTMDWVTGKLECEKLGGTLTVPITSNHAAAISNFVVKDHIHVGISRKDNLSPYLDLNGTEMELVLGPGYSATYDCIQIYRKELITVPCTGHPRYVVCQIPV